MLKRCAPGYEKVEKTHYWRVTFGTQVYPSLPTGRHGRRANPEIEVGHVKQMVKQFGIEDCAGREIERLRTKRR